jgi:sugar lactone lactonase YvrE
MPCQIIAPIQSTRLPCFRAFALTREVIHRYPTRMLTSCGMGRCLFLVFFLSALAGCGSHETVAVDAGQDEGVGQNDVGNGPAMDTAGVDEFVDGGSADTAAAEGGRGDRDDVGFPDLGIPDLGILDLGGNDAGGDATDVQGADASAGQDEGAGEVGDHPSNTDGVLLIVDTGSAPDVGLSNDGAAGNVGDNDAASDVAGPEVASCTVSPSGSQPDAGAPLPDNVQFVPNVTVTTIAGGPNPGTVDGVLGVGLFSNPVSVAIEPEGSLVVADFDTDLLRRVSANGTISTLTNQSTFQRPFGLAFLGSVLYAQTDADQNGDRGSTTGTLWRIDRVSGVATVAAADIGHPRGFAALSDGRLVLSDFANQRVGIIDLATGVVTDLAGLAGCPGSANGTGAWARFLNPQGVAVLTGNRIIVADREAHLLREVSLTGVVTTFAGDGVAGTMDGARASSRFVAPQALAADNTGAILVSDVDAHRIRRIASDGTVSTVAGNGTAGFADGSGQNAAFFGQEGLAVSADGKTIYVADGTGGSETPVPYQRLRKITLAP